MHMCFIIKRKYTEMDVVSMDESVYVCVGVRGRIYEQLWMIDWTMDGERHQNDLAAEF